MSMIEIKEAIRFYENAYLETGDDMYLDAVIDLKSELSKVES